MNPDKITVDEPLISTDVDHLIRAIAEKKKVNINDLRRICKIDKRNLDKWISVLEDEGYIDIEYNLSGTQVLWKGLQDTASDTYKEDMRVVRNTTEHVYTKEPISNTNMKENPSADVSLGSVRNSQDSFEGDLTSANDYPVEPEKSSHGGSELDSNSRDSVSTPNTANTESDQPTEMISVSSENAHGSDLTDGSSALVSDEVIQADKFPEEMPLEESELVGGAVINQDTESQSPEDMLNEYLVKKRQPPAGRKLSDIKSSILTNLNDDSSEEADMEKDAIVQQDEAKEIDSITALDDDPAEQKENVEADEVDSGLGTSIDSVVDIKSDYDPDNGQDDSGNAIESIVDYPEDNDEEIANLIYKESEKNPSRSNKSIGMRIPEEKSESPSTIDVREIMDAYLKEINIEKTKIQSLKKQKEYLYQEKIAGTENRMNADIAAFTEKIIEKQNNILHIKESVLELPDKVEEVEMIHNQMKKLRLESRAALERTKKKSEDYIKNLEASKSDIETKVTGLSVAINSQAEKVSGFEDISRSLAERTTQISGAMAAAQDQIKEMADSIEQLQNDLASVQQTKQEIDQVREEVLSSVASHNQELDSLTSELENISKAEHWVQEYVRDYQQKIADIDEYVSRSEDDLVNIKEAAESLYMKKYLGELEDLADSYEGDLDDAVRKEKDIDEKISDSRTRISSLARESQDMIKKIRKGMSDSRDYDEILKSIRGKTSRINSMLQEKQTERKRLEEDIRNVKSSDNVVLSRSPSRPKISTSVRNGSKTKRSSSEGSSQQAKKKKKPLRKKKDYK
ncbi:hypothetical protein KKD40_00695 [Candidatus Micrarchaeota archaeon]|nr:hypothetical protein [Candidatus Micrarchaeota archaeon]